MFFSRLHLTQSLNICLPELHKSGRWHFHGIGVNCDKLKFEKSGIVKNGKEIYNINKRSFRYGFTTATKIESTEKVNNYITKYITKELITMSKVLQHRYLYSKNLAKPQSETLYEEDYQQNPDVIASKLNEGGVYMSKNTQITVNDIFELLRNGKQHEGVDLLYKYHYNKMYGVAFSIVKKEDVSQDIVHNVIYKLILLETNKFPSSNELTWLYKVVKNEALMFLRNNNPIISLDDVAVEPIVENRDIHDFVDMDSYYSMIKGLNDEQRQVVTLKVLGGYTHKEISIILGKPIGTIQWIYNTSIKKLKITLSSIMVVIILSGVGFITRLINYITKMNTAPEEIPGQTIHIPFDCSIIAFAVVFVFVSILFLLVFKKSHKIPTKAERKNI